MNQPHNNRIEYALPKVGLGPRIRSASHAERYRCYIWHSSTISALRNYIAGVFDLSYNFHKTGRKKGVKSRLGKGKRKGSNLVLSHVWGLW
jgi:hypothetical protein